ncbi:MAG: cytochrome c biogenesis protein CcdA [bacterium]|nr:cytochrome c biogenesis protein CcdA [bacterium]
MRKLLNKLALSLAAVAFVVIPLTHSVHAEQQFGTAEIYYNEACSGCNVYLKDKLVPFLEEQGISVTLHDYVNVRSSRRDMNDIQNSLGIPYELQSHIMTFLAGGKLTIGGHVPLDIVADALNADELPENLVIFQDQMLEMGIDPEKVEYTVWQPEFAAKSYPLAASLNSYLDDWRGNRLPKQAWQQRSILPLVLVTGLLDGINPCAIAVLIFFIAFLFTLQSGLGKIFRYGIVYIAVIYLTYLAIGFGLLKAIIISGEPHLMAKIGAWLVIALGVVQLINHYQVKFPFKLQIPKFSQGTLKYWLTKSTMPAVIVGAFFVGLCTFPCSGGIYVAIIGLLAANNTFWQGLGYLLVYNVMFVAPLIVLLALAANKFTLGKVAQWQSEADKGLKFWSGLTMIALGIIILIWFV